MTRSVVRRWIKAPIDLEAVARLRRETSLDDVLCRLLAARGVSGADDAERYLSPRLKDLPEPSLMKGLDKAVERIARAIEQQERIALYGDYDVDGVTSTSLFASFLSEHGVQAHPYIPKRLTEGYGLNPEAVDQLAQEQIQLLITLDCGITAADEIARANRLGIDCIVVDHHRCPPELPPAYANLNHQQPGCAYPDKQLAAVGVSFNVLMGLRRVLRARGFYENRVEPDLRRYLDLVALGTIADMVALSGVNRILTWHGLRELRLGNRPGIRALMDVSRVKMLRCSSSDVGFRLAPRINAAGRLDDASVGVQLLLAPDFGTAVPLAESLDRANGERQRIEAQVLAEAIEQVEALAELPAALVLEQPSWHPGVVGIVASKLVERYHRPAILIGEGGRGSARTAAGIHIYDCIRACEALLIKFGGHRAAAGLTIARDRVGAFRTQLVSQVELDPGREGEAQLIYDDELPAETLDRDHFALIEQLQPFGMGNPEPLFRSAVRLHSSRVVGKGHLKLRLAEGKAGSLEAIAFNRGEMHAELAPNQSLDLAYHLDRNEFSGMESLEFRVRDLKPLA